MGLLTDHIPNAPQADIQRLDKQLQHGERLRWAVRPVPTALTRHGCFFLAFGTLWMAFIAFFTYGVLGYPTSAQELAQLGQLDGERLAMAVFSIPFWLAGIGFLCQPWLQKRRMRHMVYALTDRRALIFTKKLFRWDIRPYALAPDLVLERKVGKQGCGDLIFEEEPTDDSRGSISHGFLNVPDLERAESEIENALRARQEAKDCTPA